MQRLDIGGMEGRVFRFEITKEDFTRFNVFHFTRSKQMIWMHQRGAIGGLIAATVAAFLLVMRDITKDIPIVLPEDILPYIIILSICGICFFASIHTSIVGIIRGFLKNGEYPEFVGTCTLTLTADAIRMDRGGYITETNYSLIRDIAFNSDAIYIYVGEFAAHIIPDAAFENGESKSSQTAFVEFIRAKANLAA
jgi:hypothetical protein